MLLVIAATTKELAGAPAGVACGIGPVDAAAAATRAIVEKRPDAVLHVGIAGERGFEEPRVVIGSESRYCDTDSHLITAVAHPDPQLLDAARAALPDAPVVAIGTSARVNGTTGCAVEAMEGFAVLRACELAGVPALEVRVTANEIDEPDRALWRFDDAFALLARTLPGLIETLDA